MTTAIEKWETLADHLRSELEEYGELLRKLCEQQDKILERDAVAVLETNKAIEQQAQRCQRARICRETLADDLAEAEGLSRGLKLKEICKNRTDLYQNLFAPLVETINESVARARRKGSQNHLLLGRACRVTEELIETIQPGKITKTYTRKGMLKLKASTSGSHITQSV